MRGRARRWRAAAAAAVALALAAGSSRAGDPPAPAAEDLRALAAAIDRSLARVRARELRSDRDTPWVVLHGVIAFEQDLSVWDAEAGESLNAVEFLLSRARHEEQRIVRVVDGRPALPPRERYFEVQDHVDQLLMALADAGVPLDRPLVAEGGQRFVVGDLLAAAQAGFDEGQELGWTLVVLASYAPFDASWKGASGRSYGLEDVLRLALTRDPRRETEGGTHHLYGVAYALREHRRQGRPPTGTWAEAADYLRAHAERARRFQQPDGALSAAVLRGSQAPTSPRQLVSSTGHALEWLALALPPEELREAWVRRAVARLCEEMLAHPLEAFSDGGLYHAAHALRLYREAVLPGGLPLDYAGSAPEEPR